MCEFFMDGPLLVGNKIFEVRKLIGNNITDYEELKPMLEIFEKSDYNESLIEWCEHAKRLHINKDYNEYRKKALTIRIVEIGWYEVLLPWFMNRVDIETKSEAYKQWLKCMENLMNK